MWNWKCAFCCYDNSKPEENFVEEIKILATVLTVCTKTVLSVEWLQSYWENLADTLVNQF